MSLVFISISSCPTYIALSTDIQDGKISGASFIGKLVYLTDTKVWKIVGSNRVLYDYIFP